MEFEAVIEKHPEWEARLGLPVIQPLKVMSRMVSLFARILGPVLRVIPCRWPARDYLCVGYLAPHYVVYKTFPYFCLPGGLRMLWMYDVWESERGAVEKLIRKHRINIAFITSLQSTEYFNRLGLQDFAAYWSPEAVVVGNYRYKPYYERTTEVIQIGRKWDVYHKEIEPFCRVRGYRYLYEKVRGEIIFPTWDGFLDGIADAKVSICVPSSITHPARSGNVATMTSRYLQSMASKCLVVGVLPEEMRKLFDYSPIIEIDMSRPCEQLGEILENFGDYADLIARNYNYVMENHQCSNRLATMMEQIQEYKQGR